MVRKQERKTSKIKLRFLYFENR